MSLTEDARNSIQGFANLHAGPEITARIQLSTSLMQVRKEYSPSAADHGRAVIYKALLGFNEYVSQIMPQHPDLLQPLRDLLYNLRSLDNGSVAPMLMPAEIDGRRPNPISQALFHAHAAALMQLKQWQGLERLLAADAVARDLNKWGYRNGGNRLDRKCVVVWRNKMKKPADASCVAAARYRTILEKLKAEFPKDPKSAYRFLLDTTSLFEMPSIPGKPTLK